MDRRGVRVAGVVGPLAAAATATVVVVAQHGAVAATTPPPQSTAPLWRLSVAGQEVATSRQCSGLGSRSDVIAHRSGTGGPTAYLPGELHPTPVTCAFPLVAARELYDWRREAEEQRSSMRRAAQLDLVDQTGVTVQSWRLANAWPSQYLVAHDRTVLVLAHEGATLQP